MSRDTVLWNVSDGTPATTVRLHHAPEGGLSLHGDGVRGGREILLTRDPAGPDPEIRDRFPHLASHAAYRLPAAASREVASLVKGQLAVSAVGDSILADATAVQIPGVLDDRFGYTGPLGATFDGRAPTVRLWAPTARAVTLLLFDDARTSAGTEVRMIEDAGSGTWTATGSPSWYGKFYLFRVEVFVRSTGGIESNLVTDPNSVSLSRNSARSHLVSLEDPAWMPRGWRQLAKPPLQAPEDIVLYELHVRDFSASDTSVPEPLRGTFAAFTLDASRGVQHLTALARAGVTHVHLLPAFDIATVDEDRTTWLAPAGELSREPPDSEAQQAAVSAAAARDGYNWGYDPWHYSVPEGSYATEPEGAPRIREFREMVRALGARGLRVVMDVVYNHTTTAGQDPRSVLDRVVPGYYHRLNADGDVETSTCCQNTATEHRMMEKLMVDSVVLWAKAYKVDGFRFDLMGHHLRRNLLRVREALDALTLERDGIDGGSIYVYGEGWDFGEVANNARGVNATQSNMAGTGIGTFNDRLRDAARGGTPFTALQEQGFLTGLLSDPNATAQGSPADQRARLLLLQDQIKVGLAGNLARVAFEDRTGRMVAGADVDYNGRPAGYTHDPQEAITYVEAHDNETLFDAIQLKASRAADVAARVRMQNLGMSLVGLAQGVPFFHAGVELLRSKSLDRNSFDSGDWFNRLDVHGMSNNWGVGLPPARENKAHWPVMRALLANPALTVTPDHIRAATSHLQEVLAIRRSSPLFRLRDAAAIGRHLTFLNGGPGQLAGVIAMVLTDVTGEVDPHHRRIVVVFNATPARLRLGDTNLAGERLELHPVQRASADAVVKTSGCDPVTGALEVPGRTAAVFVVGRFSP